MWLTDLADVVRAAGLTVVEVDGWRTRGHGPMRGVRGIVCHHTGTSARASGTMPTLRVLRDGYKGLPGPLSQLGLGRDGTVYIIAAGRCYHAGPADSLSYTNSYAIGIEAEHPGGNTTWPPAQRAAYVRLCRALAEHYRTLPPRGHKEIAVPYGRKTDPNFDMAAFRSEVASTSQVTPGGGRYLTVDGRWDAPTIRAVQRMLGVDDDGVAGAQTYSAIQRLIGAEPDGVFGPLSARAAERHFGLAPTTVPGMYPGIVRALERLHNQRIREGKL